MRRPLIAAAALGLALAGCATSTTPAFNTDGAPGFSASAYRTYSWAFNKPPAGLNPLQYERLRADFDRAFAARGYSRVESGGDMIVGFTVGARDRVQTTDWGPVGPYYPGWGRGYRYGWSYGYRDIDVRTVTRGSLALDVFDGRTNRPVWHGVASRDINANNVPPELVTNAVNGLVDRFAGVASGG
jgi:hypothetical protein